MFDLIHFNGCAMTRVQESRRFGYNFSETESVLNSAQASLHLVSVYLTSSGLNLVWTQLDFGVNVTHSVKRCDITYKISEFFDNAERHRRE